MKLIQLIIVSVCLPASLLGQTTDEPESHPTTMTPEDIPLPEEQFVLGSAGPVKEAADISLWVKLHADVRADVWNSSLAESAAGSARHLCETQVFAHDRETLGRLGVGENLVLSPSDVRGPNGIRQAMRGLVDEEVPIWHWENATCTPAHPPGPGRMCGHYTQIVWDETTEFGCGTMSCSNWTTRFSSVPWQVIACHYNPPGNTVLEAKLEDGHRVVVRGKRPFGRTSNETEAFTCVEGSKDIFTGKVIKSCPQYEPDWSKQSLWKKAQAASAARLKRPFQELKKESGPKPRKEPGYAISSGPVTRLNDVEHWLALHNNHRAAVGVPPLVYFY